MTTVGNPNTKMTYTKNGTTGAPVRIFRTSAPARPDLPWGSELAASGDDASELRSVRTVISRDTRYQLPPTAEAQLASTVEVAAVTCACVGRVRPPDGAGGNAASHVLFAVPAEVIAANSMGRACPWRNRFCPVTEYRYSSQRR